MNVRLWLLAAVVPMVIIGGLWTGWQWIRPYPLPAVPPHLTAQMAGLDFSKERNMVHRDPQTAASYKQLAAQLQSGNTPEREQAIISLKALVKSDPGNLVYGNLLRTTLVKLDRTSELVAFFEAVEAPDSQARVQKALAMVDGLLNPDLASASLGQLSLLSIQELDPVIEANPHNWVARLGRGLNNLYWPIGLRRNDKAIADLGYAVAILEALPEQDEPYLAIAYAGYGDALVKGGQISEGVRVWKRGSERFPGSEDLRRRVEAGEKGATDLVERERGINSFARPAPGLTDLSAVWQSPGT